MAAVRTAEAALVVAVASAVAVEALTVEEEAVDRTAVAAVTTNL